MSYPERLSLKAARGTQLTPAGNVEERPIPGVSGVESAGFNAGDCDFLSFSRHIFRGLFSPPRSPHPRPAKGRKEGVKRVTGIGAIFFKLEHPDQLYPRPLYQWYETHLGIRRSPDGTGAAFEWREIGDSGKDAHDKNDATNLGLTVWSVFPHPTKYFDPSRSPFMIDYRVDDLDALLEALKKEGVPIDPHREDYDYGRFAWIMDPDGNRIELWEPKKKQFPQAQFCHPTPVMPGPGLGRSEFTPWPGHSTGAVAMIRDWFKRMSRERAIAAI
jgi:catechol 2,3-dioxygenase-like lactoylglutathione lyase family enzyme